MTIVLSWNFRSNDYSCINRTENFKETATNDKFKLTSFHAALSVLCFVAFEKFTQGIKIQNVSHRYQKWNQHKEKGRKRFLLSFGTKIKSYLLETQEPSLIIKRLMIYDKILTNKLKDVNLQSDTSCKRTKENSCENFWLSNFSIVAAHTKDSRHLQMVNLSIYYWESNSLKMENECSSKQLHERNDYESLNDHHLWERKQFALEDGLLFVMWCDRNFKFSKW